MNTDEPHSFELSERLEALWCRLEDDPADTGALAELDTLLKEEPGALDLYAALAQLRADLGFSPSLEPATAGANPADKIIDFSTKSGDLSEAGPAFAEADSAPDSGRAALRQKWRVVAAVSTATAAALTIAAILGRPTSPSSPAAVTQASATEPAPEMNPVESLTQADAPGLAPSSPTPIAKAAEPDPNPSPAVSVPPASTPDPSAKPEPGTPVKASPPAVLAASQSPKRPDKLTKAVSKKENPDDAKETEYYALSNKHPALSGNGKVRGGIPEASGSIPVTVTYNKHIRPILSENCFHCHGPDPKTREADYRLDVEADAKADLGGYQGIAPGSPDESELIARVLSKDPDDVMPPPDSNRFLSDEQREILRRWVAQGAEYQKHWSFELPVESEPPAVSKADWPRNPIDQFILARLDSEGLDPSPEADRATLLRRLSLDLTGLPPTPDELDSFLANKSPTAYEEEVERLLKSQHYGERMVLPWLDASRYADSNGFQQDGDRHQWIWRDWVVKAMNDNMPFDQFTIEQLAGDLLPNPTTQQLIATGFNRNHMLNGEGGAIPEEQRNNYVFDRVDTTATTWLALTLACAQCHDHKYDPLTQKDYYSFFAYFNNLPETGKVDKRGGRIQYAEPSLSLASPEQEARMKEIGKETTSHRKVLNQAKAEIDKAVRAWWDGEQKPDPALLSDKLKPQIGRLFETIVPSEQREITTIFLRKKGRPEWKTAQAAIDKLDAEKEKLQRETPVVMIMKEQEERRPTHILSRGDYESPLEEVRPALPEVLSENQKGTESSRLVLAKWLVSADNPLTARVIVNRYWQTFFGTGLVKTAEDFGVQGELPTHPELLDWLALEFIRSGWDVKHMHRLIVTSATYRQSSKVRPEVLEKDPRNRLLTRGSRYRLPSLLLRDQALFVSGLMNDEVGGRPVYPYQPEGLWKEFSYEKFSYTPSSGEDLYRRSLYTFWRRTVPPPNMFDSPNRQTCTVKPALTNTPVHALITLNDPTYVEAARKFGERMMKMEYPNGEVGQRLRAGFRLATARYPTETELEVLLGSFDKARANFEAEPSEAHELLAIGESPQDVPGPKTTELAAYAMVAQLILNLDETLTRE